MVKLRVSPLVKLMVLTLRVTPSATRRALAKEQSLARNAQYYRH